MGGFEGDGGEKAPQKNTLVFAGRALMECMGISPKVANQMANLCSGLYDNYQNGKYNSFLQSAISDFKCNC